MLRSSPSPKHVLEEALRLAPEDQADIAAKLIRGLEENGDKHSEAAFRATLLRRWMEMETGAVKGVSTKSLLRRLRARVKKKP